MGDTFRHLGGAQMPWQECYKMDERLRFVARLLDGEKMAAVCREFDISRKTGYKIFSRYKDCGLDGLTDRSRRPYRHANRLPLESSVVASAVYSLIAQKSEWHGTATDLLNQLNGLTASVRNPRGWPRTASQLG